VVLDSLIARSLCSYWDCHVYMIQQKYKKSRALKFNCADIELVPSAGTGGMITRSFSYMRSSCKV
jgi:hypothetical protein